MKYISLYLFILCTSLSATAQKNNKAPGYMLGKFTDDYGINYIITDSLWQMGSEAKYHLLKWDTEKQYIIARNDATNKTDANRYTRIDYMVLDNMEPWKWGFCLSEYRAETAEEAEKVAIADRANPKKGCNGYPFSRMKKYEEAKL